MILLMALMMLLDIIIHTILTTFATSMIAATDHELVLDAGDGRSISIISMLMARKTVVVIRSWRVLKD